VNLSFVFWNLNGKPLWDSLASIVMRHDIDIVMLAECPEEPTEVCRLLEERTKKQFHFAPGPLGKLQLLTKFPESALTPVFDNRAGRLTIRRLRLDDPRIDILVAVVHLPSKLHYSDNDQLSFAIEIVRDINDYERRFPNARTIIVGDFNMNPFEQGIVSAMGLHAVMTRAIAEGESRTVSARDYRYFYNPMWSCFGDRSEGPAGTYYYRKSTPISYFWNIFDQVLLRPEIMHWLKELRILDHDGSTSLLNERGRPDSVAGSDHLPLYFRLHP
jgi:endonuclease/exonuclease/phosphatase (EEP) superfamily protein YafD